MKKLMILSFLVLGILCTVFLFPSAGQAIPTARLELIAPPTIYVGDSFDIEVYVDGVTDTDPLSGLPDEVIAFGFDLDYDSVLFSYDGAVVGPSFNDDSLSFPNTDAAGSAFPGISGDNILLATLSFTALNQGTSYAGIYSDISDPNEGLTTWFYYYDTFTGTPGQIDLTSSLDVTVASAAPVPEPATLLLVTTGLGGLFGFRKKFRKK